MEFNEPADITYYYKPILFSMNLKPLVGFIIVFSMYADDERTFLLELALILGAKVEETYRRIERPLLICATVQSAKYGAAIKWSEYFLQMEINLRDELPISIYCVFRFAGCDL